MPPKVRALEPGPALACATSFSWRLDKITPARTQQFVTEAAQSAQQAALRRVPLLERVANPTLCLAQALSKAPQLPPWHSLAMTHKRRVRDPSMQHRTAALMCGNFVIGCGVMVVAGALNDLSASLMVSVALAGQLISFGAAAMALGAPILALWVSGSDRRRLLVVSLVWYGLGHGLCALMPNYATLVPVRTLTVLGAAVFTPQAAAAIGHMTDPTHRGRAITSVFLGWSLASVLGVPLLSFVAESWGWRWAFGSIAAMSLPVAFWVWCVVPDGVKPPALTLTQWRQALTNPVLLAMVSVTALCGAGQFTLSAYLAPYYRQVLHASPAAVAFLFLWFGVFGVLGNFLLTRGVDRFGPPRAVTVALLCLLIPMTLWSLATSMLAVCALLIFWGLGCFSSNSAQQARLSQAAPVLAPALMALNTSAIYLGQGVGAGTGGWLVRDGDFAPLAWVGAAWLICALGVSAWVERADRRVKAAAATGPLALHG